MATLQDRTFFITGGSRGIGKAIALRLAQDGANVAIAAKTDKPHESLPGTIHSAAEEIEAAGGKALALRMDVRDETQVAEAVAACADAFGGIDGLINNASAINLTGTLATPMRRFDLMFGVNVRGTFACSRAAVPWLQKSDHAHILNISPPLNLSPKWFEKHTAYTMSKYGMSMCVLGMAAEFARDGIAVNALWPRTVIDTAALRMVGEFDRGHCRKPTIMADAAYAVLAAPPAQRSGEFLIDETVLRESGVTDFSAYAVDPAKPLFPDFFL